MASVKVVAPFLVSNKVANTFKYLGVRGPVGQHATVWGVRERQAQDERSVHW
jgi:hypothetical protein